MTLPLLLGIAFNAINYGYFWFMVLILSAAPRQGAQYVMFDTERDKSETHDFQTEAPRAFARLKGELQGWMLKDEKMRLEDGLLVPRDVADLATSRMDPGALRLEVPSHP